MVGFLLVVTVAVSGFSASTMSQIGTEIEGIAKEDMPITDTITKFTILKLE